MNQISATIIRHRGEADQEAQPWLARQPSLPHKYTTGALVIEDGTR